MENYALVSEKEVGEMKKRILKGEFLDKNYLAQYDSVDCSSAIKRFCLYKSDAEKTWRGEDCDVSLAAVVTYSMMYVWLDDTTIQWQPGSCVKYCVMSQQGNQYRGDTMTSAWTVFRKYLFCLMDEESQDSVLRRFFGMNRQKHKLTTLAGEDDPYENFTDYFYKLIIRSPEATVKELEEKMSDESKKFLDNYLKAGNMIAVPEFFNKTRSNGGEWDAVDRMLWKIYQYFENGKNDRYLNGLFSGKREAREAALNKCKLWFMDAGFNSWPIFVEKNLLQPFVDEDNNWKPISLKTGKAISLKITEDYMPMPTTLTECEVFFKTANNGIGKRCRLIWEKIQGKP